MLFKKDIFILTIAAVYIFYMWKLRRPQKLLNVFSKLNKFTYRVKSYNLRHVWEYTGQKTGYWHNDILQKSKHDEHESYHMIYSIQDVFQSDYD